MKTCPSILELFAWLENIGDNTDEIEKHAEGCENCTTLAATIGELYAIAPVIQRNLPVSQKEALDILNTSASEYKEDVGRDTARLHTIFRTEEGRSYAYMAAKAILETVPIPETLDKKLAAAAEKIIAENRQKTILSYILAITTGAGEKIRLAGEKISQAGAELRDALLTVVSVPALTPAMQAVRSPVYDDVAIIEKRKKAELPFYFDKDTVVKITVAPEPDFLTLTIRLIKKGGERTTSAVFVNGERAPEPTVRVKPQPRIDVQVEDESGREYCCRIELK